jgi:hypothetical protein
VRAGVALAVAAALVAGLALVAMPSRPEPEPPMEEYPLAPGMKWTYGSRGGPKVVRHAAGERVIDGRRYVEMKFVLPLLGTHVWPVRWTRAGVVTWHEGREHLLMKFPMRAGDRWTIDVPGLPGLDEVAECEVAGPEKVPFLGEERTATRLNVTRVHRKTGRRTTDTEWYAPGYGLVRMQVTFGIRATFTLEKFERGSR